EQIVRLFARRSGDRFIGLTALQAAQQVDEGEFRDELESLRDSSSGARDRLDKRIARQPERFLQRIHREDVSQVALVELHDNRNSLEGNAVGLEVFLQVVPALEILRKHCPLRVGDEDDAVGPSQHDAPRLVEGRLAGYRRELETDLVPLDVAELDREQVEIDRAIGLGRQVQ